MTRFIQQQSRRCVHADHLGEERKEHVGHLGSGRRIDQIGRTRESEFGRPLRGAEAPDELAIRGGRDQEQRTPPCRLRRRKRARDEDERGDGKDSDLERRHEHESAQREDEAGAEDRPEQNGRDERYTVRQKHDCQRACGDVTEDPESQPEW